MAVERAGKPGAFFDAQVNPAAGQERCTTPIKPI
jgi:hypothetical protein